MVQIEQQGDKPKRSFTEVVKEYMGRDPEQNTEKAWRLYRAELEQIMGPGFSDQRATPEADPETSSG